jgi:hypothetical protein
MKPTAYLLAVGSIVLAAHICGTRPAVAISEDVAKKCRELAIKSHPKPVAGTKARGAEKAQRDYFQECVAREERNAGKDGK